MNIHQSTTTIQAQGSPHLELNIADDLRIPKRAVLAEVTFLYAAKQMQPCFFFLSPFSPRGQGEESIAEYLNSLYSFFPLRDKISGEFFIVHVNQILYVRESPVPEKRLNRPLHLFLADRSELRVYTCEPRRNRYGRPLDLLNEAERFITFVENDTTLLHVNKFHIVRVEGI